VLLGAVDLVIKHERGESGDEPFYAAMAAHPGRPHNFPYAYRVGIPYLVHVLPFSQVVSFTLLTFVAVAAAAAALHLLLGDHDVGARVAAGLALGFALSPTLLVVLVRHGRSIDPASVLVMILGALFVERRRRVALAVTLLVGTTVRESTLFLIPYAYAVWSQTWFDRRAMRDVARVALVPVAVYFTLRTAVDAVGRQYIPGYTGPFLHERFEMVKQALSGSTRGVELRRLAYTYGPVWLVAPPALLTSRVTRRGLVIVALCLASMTYAFDWGRIIFLAAPVFYLAAGVVVRDRPRLAAATIALLFAVDIGYGVYLEVHGVAAGIDTSVGRGIPVYR
jgi:hypothetical protein